MKARKEIHSNVRYVDTRKEKPSEGEIEKKDPVVLSSVRLLREERSKSEVKAL